MDLVRDVLDARLVDREQQALGRVDDVLIRVRRDGPPRFVAMEVGVVALARRSGPRIARLVRWITRKFSPVPVRTVRYSPQLLRHLGVDLEVDVTASRDPRLLRFEKWLSRRIVQKLPGGKA